ncbi:MAG: peptidase [Ignavibacteriales bacterium]|nr:peptidase [Ignavibacteriales bacterium]MCF8316430.1 peptidase [Ignavibacteriales bacterium]MCF8437910.1 peptidase [Ignavibacteriales bacterium]
MKFKGLIVFSIYFYFFTVLSAQEDEGIKMLNEKIAKFAEVEIGYDNSILSENEKKTLVKIYEAAKVIDEIFLEQVYEKNSEIRNKLISGNSEKEKLNLKYFEIMFGPFDRLDANKPFYGTTAKPLGANFYPADMSKDEFEKYILDHPSSEKEFTSEFTMIRRKAGQLTAIPYSEYFKDKLKKASAYLREAATFTENSTLSEYLNKRALAFETNDYYESDMAWMDLKNHVIEVIIGPYEVYEDELFNYKASFECFLTLVDPIETKKLEIFASYLDDMEANLPLADKHKQYKRGSESPIVVANEVFTAGDTKAGVQTLAFNLPNDERVRAAKGSKKVMLKNVHEAKFEKLLKPIAGKILDESYLKYVTFDAFFNHTLMHEMSHGIGPGVIKIDGKDTEVKKELKEMYSIFEECKADILGLFNNIYLTNKNVFAKEFEKELWTTFATGIFRSVRFGISSAHGGGNAIIYNYLSSENALYFDPSDQKLKINYEKMFPAVKDLAAQILLIQATGDYQGAKDFYAKYGRLSESMKILIGKLNDLPVDIKPIFAIQSELN